ncbi:Hypothetical predicted protein [Olea europaea subsp. europaea]|uniref:Uncharacterized protein n=1 Tax=Olea europaea subsp. europaea TaxID=158383 RepID=A0A8S0VJN0_OLEEU|nr:Hypothetical predicted protein [Olea europaea subsp. europaea]
MRVRDKTLEGRLGAALVRVKNNSAPRGSIGFAFGPNLEFAFDSGPKPGRLICLTYAAGPAARLLGCSAARGRDFPAWRKLVARGSIRHFRRASRNVTQPLRRWVKCMKIRAQHDNSRLGIPSKSSRTSSGPARRVLGPSARATRTLMAGRVRFIAGASFYLPPKGARR